MVKQTRIHHNLCIGMVLVIIVAAQVLVEVPLPVGNPRARSFLLDDARTGKFFLLQLIALLTAF